MLSLSTTTTIPWRDGTTDITPIVEYIYPTPYLTSNSVFYPKQPPSPYLLALIPLIASRWAPGKREVCRKPEDNDNPPLTAVFVAEKTT